MEKKEVSVKTNFSWQMKLQKKKMLHPFDQRTKKKLFGLNKIRCPKNDIINL